MSTIIITEENKLRSIVQEEVSKLLPTNQPTKAEIDTMTLDSALAFLAEHGYPMSKAKLYKLTASEDIPCRKFGQINDDIKTLNRQLEEGRYSYTQLKQEGILLYDSGRFKLARRRKLNFKEIKQQAEEYFNDKFQVANEFLIGAKLFFRKRLLSKGFLFVTPSI